MTLNRGNTSPTPTPSLVPHNEPPVALSQTLPTYTLSAKPCRDIGVHSWYTSVMAFPSNLVGSILDSFTPNEKAFFVDPHCGAGTSLVEAQRRGLKVLGIDANPTSVLASKVKTNWSIDLSLIRNLLEVMADEVDTSKTSSDDSIMTYLKNSGMVQRGWIGESAALRAVAIKRWIDNRTPRGPINRFFMLSLMTSVVRDLANVKFGPEIYCVPAPSEEPDVIGCVTQRLQSMINDLETNKLPKAVGTVRQGDSRDGRTLKSLGEHRRPIYVITSPPYPTEHDYTRNARLELVFTESVKDTESLRRIKKRMIRSHSKGIYSQDKDGLLVEHIPGVQELKEEIQRRITGTKRGFEGQYPKVVVNYFGGMLRHFSTLSRYLPSGSRLAYVVGDEASYKAVHIPTAQILAEILETQGLGLRLDNIAIWRSRRAQTDRPLREHVLFLSKQ